MSDVLEQMYDVKLNIYEIRKLLEILFNNNMLTEDGINLYHNFCIVYNIW